MSLSANEIEAIAGRLAALHASADHAVERFDAGPRAAHLAVLPSAFNPPTLAHLELMARGAGAAAADPAALLTTRNVSKGIEHASLEDRVGMLLAAAKIEPFAVFAGNSARFVDQARALRSSHPGARFDFIAGYDTLIRIFDPRFYVDMAGDLAEFFAHHRVLAANRAEDDLPEVERFIREQTGSHGSRILPFELPAEAARLSSSAAREEVPRSAVGLPLAVAAYIRERSLYGAQASSEATSGPPSV